MNADEIKSIAKTLGFGNAYCLHPHYAQTHKKQDAHPDVSRLCYNVLESCPEATCIVLLVKNYVPYSEQSYYPGYYVASNAGYHGCKAFTKQLVQQGYLAQTLEVPVKQLICNAGIGVILKNDLVYMDGFGTRTVFFTVATNACLPEETEKNINRKTTCVNCHACESACPVGAIDKNGFHWQRCIRTYMDSDVVPDWVKPHITTLLGCELCQHACPENIDVGCRLPDAEMEGIFALKKLLADEIKEAKQYIGKNMATHKRLSVHAAILAANRECRDVLPYLRAKSFSLHEGEKDAAEWAIKHLMQ